MLEFFLFLTFFIGPLALGLYAVSVITAHAAELRDA